VLKNRAGTSEKSDEEIAREEKEQIDKIIK
jgi:hypothetical protein